MKDNKNQKNSLTPKKAPAKILLIEDEKFLRELFNQLLEEAGYSVFCIPDPREAYDILDKEKIDLIVSGIMMPHKDGLTLLKELKANPKYKDIPFIICSNLGEEFVKKALSLGAEKFLDKSKLTSEDFVKEVNFFLNDKNTKDKIPKALDNTKNEIKPPFSIDQTLTLKRLISEGFTPAEFEAQKQQKKLNNPLNKFVDDFLYYCSFLFLNPYLIICLFMLTAFFLLVRLLGGMFPAFLLLSYSLIGFLTLVWYFRTIRGPKVNWPPLLWKSKGHYFCWLIILSGIVSTIVYILSKF